MKNKIFTILLSLLLVLSTFNIVYAEVEYPFMVTYHFKYKTSATAWGEKTWSQKVTSGSGSASKIINKIISDSTVKTITTEDTIYTFKKTWTGEGKTLNSTDRVYIYNKDYTEATDLYYEADYEEEKLVIPVATVHIKYLNQQGQEVENTISQKIPKGIGWTITEGAFDDDIGLQIHFEHDGKIYDFIGWDKSLPLSITNLTEDTDYYFNAQYKITDIRNLSVQYIDNISNGYSSWANDGSFETYTHTFKEPANIPAHYTFLYWEGKDKKYYVNDKIEIVSDELEKDTELEYIATYEYQPELQINYHYDNNKVYTVNSYEDVNLYGAAPDTLKWFYKNEDTPISEEEVITIPESITTTKKLDNKKVVDVYAKYFTITWINDDGTELYIEENVPYGEMPRYQGAEPSKEATPQYTYKFIDWDSDIEPAVSDKTYKAVYKEILNIYTITFIDDETILTQTDYAYGTAAEDIERPVPIRELDGQHIYKFIGWEPEITDVVDNATYVAQWEIEEIPIEPEPEPEPTPGLEPQPTPAPIQPKDDSKLEPSSESESEVVPESEPETEPETVVPEEEPEVEPEINPEEESKVEPESEPTQPTETKPTKETNKVKRQNNKLQSIPTVRPTSTFNGWIPTNESDSTEEEKGIDIGEVFTPTSNTKTTPRYWALINLLCVILSAILFIISIFIKTKKYDEEKIQKQEKSKKRTLKLVGLFSFLSGLILFLLSEDITATMILIDKWTIINVLLLIESILTFKVLLDNKKEKENETEE